MGSPESVEMQGSARPALAASAPRPSSFAADVVRLASGATAAQAIGVLAAPVLSRLYTPEDFGVLALFGSLTGIITVVASLRYEFAIMLPKGDEDAANVLAASLALVVLTSALTMLVTQLGSGWLAKLTNATELGSYLWLAPLAVLFGGAFHTLTYWNSRTGHFGRLSAVRVFSVTSTTGTKVAMGYAGHGGAGTLIGATVLGPALSSLALGWRIWRDDGLLLWRSVRLRTMLHGLTRYRRFPLIDIWSALLNALSGQLPNLILVAYFGTAVVGLYSRAVALLYLPAGLVGTAIAQVYFQRASRKLAHGEQVGHFVEMVFERLLAVALLPLLAIAFLGPDLFSIALGPAWREAGVYASLLLPWVLVNFLFSPLSTTFTALERQGDFLLFNLTLTVARAGSLLVGGVALRDARWALVLYSVANALVYAYWTAHLVAAAGGSLRRLLVALARCSRRAAPLALGVGIGKYAIRLPFPLQIVTAAITSIPYLVWVWRQRMVPGHA